MDGKNPLHCVKKSRCIVGRNQKFLSLFGLGLLPCTLASGLLARQQTEYLHKLHFRNKRTVRASFLLRYFKCTTKRLMSPKA